MTEREIFLEALDMATPEARAAYLQAACGGDVVLRRKVEELLKEHDSDDSLLACPALEGWNVEAGQTVVSINQSYTDACFAANGRVLVVATYHRIGHEIGFYDLARPDRVPRRVPGRLISMALAVSPNGGLVAASTHSGSVRLFDPAMGELESLHGHLNGSQCIAFSPDGSRLASASGGREGVKLWEVGTRQELLTLAGIDATTDTYAARWSADGDVILAGPPWQAWIAPSWEEIAAVEAKEKREFKQP